MGKGTLYLSASLDVWPEKKKKCVNNQYHGISRVFYEKQGGTKNVQEKNERKSGFKLIALYLRNSQFRMMFLYLNSICNFKNARLK